MEYFWARHHRAIFIAVLFFILLVGTLVAEVAGAQNLADVLAENGKIERQGECTYNGRDAYCLLVTHEKVIYIAVGVRKGKDFYAQHILAEINGVLVAVWNYNDRGI